MSDLPISNSHLGNQSLVNNNQNQNNEEQLVNIHNIIQPREMERVESNSEPIGNNDEPVINNNGPVVNNNEPVINGNEPVVNGNEPVINDNEPVINDYYEPIINNDEPIDNSNGPIINNNYEPIINNNEPSINSNEPINNNELVNNLSDNIKSINIEPVQSNVIIEPINSPLRLSGDIDELNINSINNIPSNSLERSISELLNLNIDHHLNNQLNRLESYSNNINNYNSLLDLTNLSKIIELDSNNLIMSSNPSIERLPSNPLELKKMNSLLKYITLPISSIDKKVEIKPVYKRIDKYVYCNFGYGIIVPKDLENDYNTIKIQSLKDQYIYFYTTNENIKKEIEINAICFAGSIHSKKLTVNINDTLDYVISLFVDLFPDITLDYKNLLYNGSLLLDLSRTIAEENITPNSNLLLTIKACKSFFLDSSFCGDYIYLSSDYLTCGVDSTVSQWFTTRGKFPDSRGLTRGINYWEVNIDCTAYGYVAVGVVTDQQERNSWIGCDKNGVGYFGTGTLWSNGTVTSYGEQYRSGDVIGVNLDLIKNTVSFSKNGRLFGVASNLIPNRAYYPAFSFYTAADRITVQIPKNRKRYPYADRSNLVTLKTYKGNRVEVDVSREASTAFAFAPADKVYDPALKMDGFIMGIGIAPERFRGYMFVYHKERPGVGGWSQADLINRLTLKEAANKELPVMELLKDIFADPGTMWIDNPDMPIFSSVSDMNGLIEESEEDYDEEVEE